MDYDHGKDVEQLLDVAIPLRPELFARDLYAIEVYFREEGYSEFVYDEELDVFRFPEDRHFAFCEDFADWRLLRERGYSDF
jgi:hypothetical protein